MWMAGSPRARGAEADPPAAAEPPPDLAPAPPPRPALDFLLLDEKPAPAATDPALDAAVRRRRALLTVHQAAGLATWGLMGATVVVGQLNYRDLYGGGGYTERYRTPHRALAYTTASAFALTGLLALLAPEPYAKKRRLDTATIHEASMAIATLGLVSQVALGIRTRQSLGSLNQRDLARAHQAVGYATFGAMTVGAVTLAF
jgi:hypothetical protein